ncbi:MAG TPA: hypothetical protein VK475_12625, partial [Pyrinomonadaceae bacterium]|nr:hypothetical protein [Pyrinomonadaceae bacterium]
MSPQKRTTIRLVAGMALMILGLAAQVSAQPAGGKSSDSSPAKPITKKAAPLRTAPKTTPSTKAGATGTAASLNGKWWTSGNGFGD